MNPPHNISRIEAFSDAVFAFAATLMVVNFDFDQSNLLTLTNTSGFWSFAVSFFVLVSLWVVHYNYFRRNRYMDGYIIALNALLLFVVLYYVFPLKSIVMSWTTGADKTLKEISDLYILYGLGFLMIFLCFSLMYYRGYKKSKSLAGATQLYFYFRHFLIFVGVSLLSIVLAYFGIGVAYGVPGFIYILLGPLCFWHSLYFHKKFTA